MVKEIARQVEIPEGVAVTVDGNIITVKGPKGEISRQLSYPEIEIRKEESHLVVNSRLDRKRQRAMVGTLAAHICNMIKGVTEGYEYKMRSCHSTFQSSSRRLQTSLSSITSSARGNLDPPKSCPEPR